MGKIAVKKPTDKEIRIKFRNGGLSEKTREAYTYAVKSYYNFIEKKNLKEGQESILKWLKTFDNPSTYNQRRQAIKEYFLKVFENEPPERKIELIEFFKSIKPKKPKEAKTQVDYITREKFEELIANTPDETSLIIETLFWTGCRISELINIKLKDCKINGTVSIRIRDGKGRKEREVFISKELYEKIRKEFKGKEFLFEDYQGNQFYREYVTMNIKRQAKKVLDIDISSHTLRHSKAMFLKDEMKLSPDRIAKALGHSSVVTTLKYYFHGTPSAEEQGIM